MRSLFSTTDARCASSSSSSSSKSCASKKSSLRTARSGAPTSTRDGVSPSRGRRRRRVSSASSGDWNSQMRNAEDERVGVLLLNLGGPETVDDVEPFLFNLFADPDIIRLPSASSSPRLLKRFFFVSSLFESVAFSHSRLARSRRRKRKPSFCESSLFVSLPWSTRTTTTTTKFFSDETRATRNRGCRCSLFLSNVSRLTFRTSSPHRRCDCERTNRTKQTACNSYNSSSRRW